MLKHPSLYLGISGHAAVCTVRFLLNKLYGHGTLPSYTKKLPYLEERLAVEGVWQSLVHRRVNPAPAHFSQAFIFSGQAANRHVVEFGQGDEP